jgi:hypothetical protein
VRPRLSITECRRLLSASTNLGDTEIEQIRDHLYLLAQALIDDFARRPRRASGAPTLPREFNQALAEVPIEERAQIEERAAILEYDGRLERDSAQRKSIADWLGTRR